MLPSISRRGPIWAESEWRSNAPPLYSRALASAPARSRRAGDNGTWYSPPPHSETPMPDLRDTSPSRVKGRRPNGVSRKTVRSPDAALRLLSGATAKPKCASQRRRARMMSRKRRMLAATAAGGVPASTCSKCRRARLSSSFRKKACASSRRTRTSSGRSTRMARNAAIASSSFPSRAFRSAAACAAASASMPARNRSPVASWPWAAAANRHSPAAMTRAGMRMKTPVRAKGTSARPKRPGPGNADVPGAGYSAVSVFILVAKAPAACPFEKWALNMPIAPTGRSGLPS